MMASVGELERDKQEAMVDQMADYEAEH